MTRALPFVVLFLIALTCGTSQNVQASPIDVPGSYPGSTIVSGQNAFGDIGGSYGPASRCCVLPGYLLAEFHHKASC